MAAWVNGRKMVTAPRDDDQSRTATGEVRTQDPPLRPACPTKSPPRTTARQPDPSPQGDHPGKRSTQRRATKIQAGPGNHARLGAGVTKNGINAPQADLGHPGPQPSNSKPAKTAQRTRHTAKAEQADQQPVYE